MSRISENLEKVEKAMKNPDKKKKHATFLRNAAIEVIRHGLESEQGRTYMSMFASNTSQLNLLTVPTQENWLREAQAYIVSNPICAIITDTQTGNGVKKDELNKLDINTNDEQGVLDLRPKEYDEMVK
jgi:hypothetical protein